MTLFLFTWPRYHSRIRIQGCLQLPPQGRRFQKSTQQLAYSSVGLHCPGWGKWKNRMESRNKCNPTSYELLTKSGILYGQLTKRIEGRSTTAKITELLTKWYYLGRWEIISICHHKTVGSPIGNNQGLMILVINLYCTSNGFCYPHAGALTTKWIISTCGPPYTEDVKTTLPIPTVRCC